MTHRLVRCLAILALAGLLAPGALAQALPDGEALPGPKDPSRPAYYYGEHYDPQKYRACREQEIAAGRASTRRCDRFKEVLPPIDPAKREHFGEFYDPRKYHECRAELRRERMPQATDCDIYRLRRKENPEYWPNAQVARPRLPEAPEVPTYREGMSAQEYFEALCAREAGEFIHRTVEAVEGIYQIRPRAREGDYEMADRYVMEDPYGYVMGDEQEAAFSYVGPRRFAFLERRAGSAETGYMSRLYHASLGSRPSSGDKHEMISGYDGKSFVTMEKTFSTQLKSQYGYTWRGISRPHDREHGITGGELIVVDLRTNEILGLRRNFSKSGSVRNSKTGFFWLTAGSCPQISKEVQGRRRKQENFDFISRVLIPHGRDASMAENQK